MIEPNSAKRRWSAQIWGFSEALFYEFYCFGNYVIIFAQATRREDFSNLAKVMDFRPPKTNIKIFVFKRRRLKWPNSTKILVKFRFE
jgi:hypothetical protein